MRAWNKLLLAVLTQCFVWAGTSGAAASEDSVKPAPAVATASDAVSQALKYTGFGKLPASVKATSQRAESIVVTGDSTPFLAERMNGHEAWRVTFDSVGLQYRGGVDPERTYYRNYEVFIEPSTGYLTKIVSRLPGEYADVFPQVPVESAEKQLRRCSEVYHGYVKDSGIITFAEAVQKCSTNVLKAKVINATCVMYSWGSPPIGHDVPRPFWIIAVRGGTPLLFHGMPPMGEGWTDPDSISLRCRAAYREIIDAVTGKGISLTNIPILEPDTLREQ